METRVECTGTFTSYRRCLLPRSLSKGRSMMKRALTGIASVGILAVTVGVETANAQSYTALLEPLPRKPIPPKAATRFAARAFRVLFRFPTRTVRKPQAVVALATIKPSPTGDNTVRSLYPRVYEYTP